MNDKIIIHGIHEGNLKNIHVEIPRNKLVVITGVSGSGKSTLAMDVLFNECQRQYLEAMSYQGIHKPKIEFMRHSSPAIYIGQDDTNKNPRSSVGTITNIYTDLRMVYEKLHQRICPACHKTMESSQCKEEIEKKNGDFKVFMLCEHCNHKMPKLTRTDFSYNTVEGACPTCQGMGSLLTINESKVIHETLSLEEGAVDFWKNRYKDYQVNNLYLAFDHYGISIKPNTPVKEYTEIQRWILYYGVDNEHVRNAFPLTKTLKRVLEGKVEGVMSYLNRKLAERKGEGEVIDLYFDQGECPACQGERLKQSSREVTVNKIRLPELVNDSLIDLNTWISDLESGLADSTKEFVQAYLLDLKTKIKRIINVGLGYLSIDRQMITLSKGETQRTKLAATLDSDLTGIIYIMDEPTMGLHPKDTAPIIQILKNLRDMGNTVVIIEHDIDVMKEADYLIEIGPAAGKYGGEIIAEGVLLEVINNPNSILRNYFKERTIDRKIRPYCQSNTIQIKNANLFNLKNIEVNFPRGCLSCVTGVSGSGKSTLIFEVLAKWQQHKHRELYQVSGLQQFQQVVVIGQSALTRMKRSNIATYSGLFQEIRAIFAKVPEAIEGTFAINHFSFNSLGGRCEHCEGLGYVNNNLLFFKDQEVICPVCKGNQFIDEILAIKYKGYSIKDILDKCVDEMRDVFSEYPKMVRIASLLQDVGLGYLDLKQTLTTLSAGEGQRLRLAKELLENKSAPCLYLMDEPTLGLHPKDVDHFLILLNRIVDAGNTIIVVEHNLQLIQASDWIVDLGPGGGNQGGELIAEGTCFTLSQNPASMTGKFL